MIATLHAYVLRELLKTFALTLVALTALFTMGGGLYNLLRYEGVNPADLFGFIPMLIPIVVTLTMPVAALFAATMVYGRLAADNELLACRAAGINVHRLFAAAVLLSVFVAAFTLLFGDLVIPDFVRRVDQYVRSNWRDLALQRLQVQGHVRYEHRGERYLLTARRAQVPTEAALRAQGLPTGEGLDYLLVEEPLFLQIDDHDVLTRCASAAYGLCLFDTRTTPIQAVLYVDQGREFDLRSRSFRLRRQEITLPVPDLFKRKESMVDLATLLRWRKRPWESDLLRPKVQDFWRDLLRYRFSADGKRRIESGLPLELVSERDRRWLLTADRAELTDKGLRLFSATVRQVPEDDGEPYYYEAPAVFLTARSTPGGEEYLEIHLRSGDQPVVEHNPRTQTYAAGRPRASFTLPQRFYLPADIVEQVAQWSPAQVFSPGAEVELSPRLHEARDKLLAEADKQRRKIGALIHFRLGFLSSTLVTVLMAAALGVIYRGARALAAFGLSCIPFAIVAILMVMARSLGEKPGLEIVSPSLTWGGLGLVLVGDLLIVRLGVRR